jgi:hypothetical protein
MFRRSIFLVACFLLMPSFAMAVPETFRVDFDVRLGEKGWKADITLNDKSHAKLTVGDFRLELYVERKDPQRAYIELDVYSAATKLNHFEYMTHFGRSDLHYYKPPKGFLFMKTTERQKF